jgi:hypothetical protein
MALGFLTRCPKAMPSQDAEKVSGWALPDKTEERLNVYARTRHTTERYVQLRIGRRAGASRSPIAADPRDGGSGSERDGIVIFLALPTLLVPLVTLGLMDNQSRSAALTGRAFRALPYRTVLNSPPHQPYGPTLRRILLVATVLQGGLAIWRYWK